MPITHIAIWTDDLDSVAAFYATYFAGMVGELYSNPTKGFTSRFVRFAEGPPLEVMRSTTLDLSAVEAGRERKGWAHVAFTVGSRAAVDELTERLRADGYRIASEPRVTGDGFYESVVLDPDGNRVEVTE